MKILRNFYIDFVKDSNNSLTIIFNQNLLPPKAFNTKDLDSNSESVVSFLWLIFYFK